MFFVAYYYVQRIYPEYHIWVGHILVEWVGEEEIKEVHL